MTSYSLRLGASLHLSFDGWLDDTHASVSSTCTAAQFKEILVKELCAMLNIEVSVSDTILRVYLGDQSMARSVALYDQLNGIDFDAIITVHKDSIVLPLKQGIINKDIELIHYTDIQYRLTQNAIKNVCKSVMKKLA